MILFEKERDFFVPDCGDKSFSNTEKGKIYRTYFRGELEMAEWVYPLGEAVIITDEKFGRPNGETKDGYLDEEFEQFEQSWVQLKEGFHIIWMGYHRDNYYGFSNRKMPLQVSIHRIEGFEKAFYGGTAVDILTLEKFEYDPNGFYGEYDFALRFIAERIINTHITSGSTPRFAVNPNRKYEIRLFVWDDVSKCFISFLENGKKLLLHRKTGNVYKEYGGCANHGILMRVYYEKGKENNKNIVVDGFQLFDGFDTQLRETFNQKLVICKTYSGFEFYAVQEEDDLYAIYSSWRGLRTFKLNKQERKFVKSIEKETIC